MKISIALATYNGEAFLEELLNSILNQIRIPDEVVISDDNSNDNTIKILDEFKKRAPFEVKLLKNSGKGFNTNFENALRNTTGDIIFICDQDDVWLKEKIEKVIKTFDANPEIYLIIHNLEFCDSELNPIGQTKIERFKNYKHQYNGYVTGMATAVRKDFLHTCFPVPNSINYDSWLHMCAVALEKKKIINDVLALYRRHDTNETKDSWINTPYRLKRHHIILSSLIFIKSINNNDLKNELLNSQQLLKYLQNIKESNSLPINNIDKIILFQKNRLEYQKYRYSILQKNRIIRIQKCIFLYLRGGYSQYSGLRSMLKDIIINVR
jgi:glycosyltransferase involved in cell wall biosynthesis